MKLPTNQDRLKPPIQQRANQLLLQIYDNINAFGGDDLNIIGNCVLNSRKSLKSKNTSSKQNLFRIRKNESKSQTPKNQFYSNTANNSNNNSNAKGSCLSGNSLNSNTSINTEQNAGSESLKGESQTIQFIKTPSWSPENSPKKSFNSSAYTSVQQEAIAGLDCDELKPLFIKQKKDFTPSVIIFHFESLFLSQEITGFWDKIKDGDQMQDFYKYRLKQELKSTLKTIGKYYTVILVFRDNKKCTKDLFLHLLRNNYYFDGAYYISKADSFHQRLVLNYNTVLSDINLSNSNVKKVLIMDGFTQDYVMTPASKVMRQSTASFTISREYLDLYEDRVPSLQINQSKIKVFLIKFKSHQYGFIQNDHKIITELAIGHLISKKSTSSGQSELRFVHFDLNEVVQEAKIQNQAARRKEEFYAQLKKIKASVQKLEDSPPVDCEKKAEEFRNKCIQYIKSFANKKLTNVHFIVGDIMVR